MDRHGKDNKRVLRSLVMVTQFGINMLVPIFLCSFLGIWLGRRTRISWLMIPFFFVGAFAGFKNIFTMARQIYEEKDEGDGNEKDDGDGEDDA